MHLCVQDIAPLAVMQWAMWDIEAGADPEDLQLVEFIAPAVNADATAEISGPYTHVARVPAWDAAVIAHRKASDDHIRLCGAALARRPCIACNPLRKAYQCRMCNLLQISQHCSAALRDRTPALRLQDRICGMLLK